MLGLYLETSYKDRKTMCYHNSH